MKNNTISVIGGGTFSHVRNHLSLAAPAFGSTARFITHELYLKKVKGLISHDLHIYLTKMADPLSTLVTNDDIDALIKRLVADASTHIIFMNAALCDYHGTVDGVPSGSHEPRLLTSEGDRMMTITPAQKVIGQIRSTRKDIFAVGFKTTTGKSLQEQYEAGLKLLKSNSINLVFANDTVTRQNIIVTPEESWYAEEDRNKTLQLLVEMTLSRSQNTFTRSNVIDGPAAPWNESSVPRSLFATVNHLIDRGAYKPFLGKTVGHFAFKPGDKEYIITSRRKSNFNDLHNTGMIKIFPEGTDRVTAVGGKPSVGGQSQRIIFKDHPDLNCIAHAHVPLRPEHVGKFPTAAQWPYECGSHQCGQNTSSNLKEVEPGIWSVFLENHGPNVVFNDQVHESKVIDFFEKYFDLDSKTGGVFSNDQNQ